MPKAAVRQLKAGRQGIMLAESFDTVVIGGGQAGLAMGYHLARLKRSFVILDANPRTGDSWRNRWDSLRLFTPARYDALPGSRYPAAPWSFPSREDFSQYLSDYAAEFSLPVRNAVRVTGLRHNGQRFAIEAEGQRFEAANVVVATGWDLQPKIPPFAAGLSPDIRQVHAGQYRNPAQLSPGAVLVVGAGNSGADIALEVSRTHRTYLSGRHPGELPWRIGAPASRPLTLAAFFAFRHLLTRRTPVGRKARPQVLAHSGPLIRVKDRDLAAAGVRRVPRTEGTRNGQPQLADGQTLAVSNVVWCTGFRPETAWIHLPVFDAGGEPVQDRGIARNQPGLFFLGSLFQHSLASSMIHGVGRDAAYLARYLATRRPAAPEPAAETGHSSAEPQESAPS
jgi:putative flavoprotein involved in K+ transport